MPTTDQITEGYAQEIKDRLMGCGSRSCLNCSHCRKLKSSLPGQMVCLLDDSTVETQSSCCAWSALFQTGGF